VVAYVDGGARAAAALDLGPNRRAVAYGKDVAKLRKQLGIKTDDAAILVGLDGKVAVVMRGLGSPDLVAAAVTLLVRSFPDYTATTAVSPGAKVGAPFDLTLRVSAASWATLNAEAPLSLKLTAPPEWTCDALTLKRPQFVVDDTTATATIRCTSAKAGRFVAAGAASFAVDLRNVSRFQKDDPVEWDVDIAP
jgi:hypothetical protein